MTIPVPGKPAGPTDLSNRTDNFHCLLEAAGQRFQRVVLDEASGTLELAVAGPTGRPGRCRLRLLTLTEGREAGRSVVFFYKPSSVPHSTDRYSYGAARWDGLPEPARMAAWFDFLESGFDPARKPPDVRRALTFTLPEFEAVPWKPGEQDVSRAFVGMPSPPLDPDRGFNPGVLQVDLFCRGLRIDPSCTLEEDARGMSRTRAGLGSGLELCIPGPLKDLWLNVPVEEDFAALSPYRLVKYGELGYRVVDDRLPAPAVPDPDRPHGYPVRLPHEPEWYHDTTRSGTVMSRVGVLQGTYLGIYLSNSCGFWYHQPEAGCHFCTTGLNVGVNEVAHKEVEDVVDVALAAKRESGNTFVHFNSGFHGGDRDLDIVAPYVKAVKERVGALVGVQVVPSKNLEKYDRLIDLGVNHFSFCYEFHNPEYFARYLPGKARLIGQDTFFRAMEYVAGKLGKGSCSGEIIAGVEPIEDTLRAIDYITSIGAFPTVCIFRPTIGSAMEHLPSPDTGEMIRVMRHMYEACCRNGISIAMAPNIEVSLIVNPDDARYLTPRTWRTRLYEARLGLLRMLAGPYFAKELRPRGVRPTAASA
jgi:hypothetical protein